jgi:hypothetical protein
MGYPQDRGLIFLPAKYKVRGHFITGMKPQGSNIVMMVIDLLGAGEILA